MSEIQKPVKKVSKPKVETINISVADSAEVVETPAAEQAMLEMIRELQKELSLLKSGNTNATAPQQGVQSRYVEVVSLFDGTLFLSTAERGEGKKYPFKNFGNTHRILSQDLDDVVRTYYNWASEGYFYIKDKKFIEESGLVGSYEHVLSKEELLGMVDGKYGEDITEMFKRASTYQKGLIYRLAVQKVASGEYNVAVTDKIERLANAYVRHLNKNLISKENPLPESKKVDIVDKGRTDGKYDAKGDVKVVEEDFD